MIKDAGAGAQMEVRANGRTGEYLWAEEIKQKGRRRKKTEYKRHQQPHLRGYLLLTSSIPSHSSELPRVQPILRFPFTSTMLHPPKNIPLPLSYYILECFMSRFG